MGGGKGRAGGVVMRVWLRVSLLSECTRVRLLVRNVDVQRNAHTI